MKLSPVTDALRARYKIADTVDGAVITAVAPGSAAAKKRLQAGDVISEAGERKIAAPVDVAKGSRSCLQRAAAPSCCWC